MAAPSYDLVLYVRDVLLKSSAVSEIVANRVWYSAPENAVFPYIAGFETFGLREDAQCTEGINITLDVHLWARDGIDPLQTVRGLAHAVSRTLHHTDLGLPSGKLLTINHRGERIFYDRDGLTGHGVVEFRALFRSI